MTPVTLTDTQSYNYPDANVPAEKKEGKFYIMRYGRAMLADFMRRNTTGEWYHGRAKYQENISYATGQQGFQRYFDYFNRKKTGERKPWTRLGMKPLQIGPKYFRIVQDKLDQVQFDAICTAIDALSRNEKAEYLAKMQAAMNTRNLFQSLGLGMPSGESEMDIPQNQDELQARMESFQNQSAMNMEVKLAKVMTIDNDWEQLDSEADLDCLRMGRCLFRDYTRNGKHYIKRIDPRNGIIFPSEYNDYRDMRHGGYLESISVGELRSEAGKELSEEQISSIASATGWTGMLAPVDLRDAQGMPYDVHKVQVFRFQYKSENYLPGQAPPKKLKEPDPEKEENSKPSPELPAKGVTYHSLYEGTLIIGTDYGYGCRLSRNQKRKWENYADCELNLHAFQCEYTMAEEVQAPIDFIMTNWIAVNDIIARAVPPGYKYDMDALENISMGKGGEPMSNGEILDIHRATGDYFYRSKDLQGNNTQDGYGITPLQNGLPEDLLKRFNNIREGLALLEAISINSVAAGNNPNPEMGKGTSELALQAAISSIGYLYRIKRKRFERLSKSLAIRIKANERRAPTVGSYTLPNGQVLTADPDPSLPDRQIDLLIENRPTKEEWTQFEGVVERSLINKEITAADMAAIKMARNLKQAWQILASRQNQNEKRMMAMQQQNQQATFEGQSRAAQEAEAAKQQTLQMQHQFKMELQDKTTQDALLIQKDRYTREKDIEALRVQGRAEVKEMEMDTKLISDMVTQQSEPPGIEKDS